MIKPSRKIFTYILAALVLILGITAIISKKAGDSAFYLSSLPIPLVIAHQGGDGIWPGNTMYAFQHAVNMGVDVIETDIRQTRDGVLVVSHDERVDGKSNGVGRVADLTFVELRTLDAAYNWSPKDGPTFPFRGQGITYLSLEEVFKAFPDMRFNIDMKQTDPPIYTAFCDLIRKYNMQDKVIAASFSHQNTAAFRKICPEVTTSADESETRIFVFMNFAYLGHWYSPNFKTFQVPIKSSGITIMTPHFVRAAHERNLRVDVWTIDDPQEMKHMIDMGVDGIITDRPDLLMKLLGRNPSN
ncbi:MAG TPA: glycerophosphodiester phosphodiesterase [Anaerolineae bacterium]|nr:glycerophosphodiester phosphodiesterase [Anaerolineae bacterium]HCC79075.1 glycerophosphodiester phosphodiesterase [Anaerolineae bacterium]HCM97407.1 glycerophosphodiester phosphodiesterase [Anaerolineae bacterium]